ncbi:MBOAT family O-acyltransferase [Neptuniibacter sp. QD37_6]|uniref:MBOAT family O-acyltransferase n=1 Tax=Neptuniibacter sp. QD37_6 TaxID=3398210 RepID=UPI0039F5FCA7
MTILFELHFWIGVLVSYIILSITPTSRKADVYGLISLTIIAIVGSIYVAVTAAIFVLLLFLLVKFYRRKPKQPLMVVTLAFIPTCLVGYSFYFDYSTQIKALITLNPFFEHKVLGSLLVLGFSYAALRSWDFLRTIRDGNAPPSYLTLLGFVFPFHMLAAGPICRYRDYIKQQSQLPATDYSAFINAICIITTGMFYKVVIAESIRIFGWGVDGRLHTDSLLETAILFIYLFFDFAGYSAVALGIGKLLGIPTPVNFDRPFLSKNITEFWSRWHISLGSFVRDNIYTPIQLYLVRKHGVKKAPAIAFVTSVISFAFTGLWHQLTLAFVTWGAMLGTVVAIEKVLRDRKISIYLIQPNKYVYAKQFIGMCYVFFTITISLHLVMNSIL